MIAPVEIRILGPFEVLHGGRPANVTGSKRHALLALLALHSGRVVAVETLVDALWGVDLPAAPRNALQHHVARIRAVLGPKAIVASADGYVLPDASVDALRFERLLAEARATLREGDVRAGADAAALALSLWRGPALEGLTDTPWFSAEARRLESLRVDAREEQFEAALALGEHREIVSALRAALAEEPFRERLWGQLMLALYRSGRQADALETFQEARSVLSDQLALEPGPELRRLQEAILAHDPAIAPVPVAARRRGNLPAAATSFVGREADLTRVVDLVQVHRLVTLTGPPGVGKTRLAIEAARVLESDLGEAGWLVDLSRTAEAEDVVRLVAQAIDARGVDPLQRVIARLRGAGAVLVLDACEHVIGEAARVASVLLAECPGVRILATSRELLHVNGEVRVHVEPLQVPDSASTENLDSPAVRLFFERAMAARPAFELTAESAPHVGEIARLVDGLPLAIELAAARVNVLGLAEVLSLVQRRLELLDDAPEPGPSHIALRELLGWSYDLLLADEQTLLQALAVHRGGASRPSLVALGGNHGLDEATVTRLLGGLVDKSIVSVSFPNEHARYDLLDTVREHVLERLAQSGDLAAAANDHAVYFVGLAESARAGLRGPDWLAWTRRLKVENDNLWAALGYVCDASDSGLALRLAAPLGWYFALAEQVSEGRRFLRRALAAVSDDAPVALHIELLATLCYLATEEADLDAAVELGNRALALAETGSEPWQAGLSPVTLALALAHAWDQERAVALAEEARVGYARVGDDWGVAASSLIAAQVAAAAGDLRTAAAMAADVHRHSQAIGYDAFEVPAMLLDAWVAERRDDQEAAMRAYGRAVELAGRTGFADHASFALAGLGSSALGRGDLRAAEELQRRALATAEAASEPWAAAHARVQLGRVMAAAGDAETAEALYRAAVEWADAARPHRARETLFVALAGSPAAGALLGLADLAATRGDGDAAEKLRARAEFVLA